MNSRHSKKTIETATINRILTALLCFVLLSGFFSPALAGWEYVDDILNRIKVPEFPDKDFDITEYGAAGDDTTDCTEAFAKAISAANKSGGGRVVVPAGVFFTGPIHLKSNVNLYVSEGATIKFSTDPNKYLPAVFTRWEGVECVNYSPMVYAYEQENVAITGEGKLDAQAGYENWWQWSKEQSDDRSRLFEQCQSQSPVERRIFGGKKLRPNMIQFYKCKNILIEDVTIKNSPMWHIHPVLSQNITIRRVTVVGHGPNNDGCNPESCKDVLIRNCSFDTGDDCIAIKSGRNNDGRRLNTPSENIVIQNCLMKDGHGGVVIGSEMTGGARNIFAENCSMDSPNLERAIRIKTNSVRGGFVENVYVRNIIISEVRESVLKINFHYEEGDSGYFTPTVRNINLQDITSHKSKQAFYLKGYERSPITDVCLKDCAFNNTEVPPVIDHVKNLVMDYVVINGNGIANPAEKVLLLQKPAVQTKSEDR